MEFRAAQPEFRAGHVSFDGAMHYNTVIRLLTDPIALVRIGVSLAIEPAGNSPAQLL